MFNNNIRCIEMKFDNVLRFYACGFNNNIRCIEIWKEFNGENTKSCLITT